MSKTSHGTDLMEGEVLLRLENLGQPYLYFIVDGDTITGCGPTGAHAWVGQKIVPRKKWRRGLRVVLRNGTALPCRVVWVER